VILYQDFNAGALSIANLFKELTEISKAAKNPAQKCFPVLSFIWLPLRRDFFLKNSKKFCYGERRSSPFLQRDFKRADVLNCMYFHAKNEIYPDSELQSYPFSRVQ
jgi:hypothetical protein